MIPWGWARFTCPGFSPTHSGPHSVSRLSSAKMAPTASSPLRPVSLTKVQGCWGTRSFHQACTTQFGSWCKMNRRLCGFPMDAGNTLTHGEQLKDRASSHPSLIIPSSNRSLVVYMFTMCATPISTKATKNSFSPREMGVTES